MVTLAVLSASDSAFWFWSFTFICLCFTHYSHQSGSWEHHCASKWPLAHLKKKNKKAKRHFPHVTIRGRSNTRKNPGDRGVKDCVEVCLKASGCSEETSFLSAYVSNIQKLFYQELCTAAEGGSDVHEHQLR